MFTIVLGVKPESFDRALQFVQVAAGYFSRAGALGFFAPFAVKDPVLIRPHPPARIELEIATTSPPGLLRVLWGMCEWGRSREAVPLEWIEVLEKGVPVPLISMPLPPFSGEADHPFRLVRPTFVGFGEQVVLIAECSRPPNPQQVDLLETALDTWRAVMQGGLPPEGHAPGESAIGATSGYFITPVTYQWFVEGLAADSACLDLLVNFFDAHAAQLSVVGVEIES